MGGCGHGLRHGPGSCEVAEEAGKLVRAGGASYPGHLPRRVVSGRRARWQSTLPEEAWFRASAGKGSKGERLYDWACVPLPHPDEEKTGRWLLMRRSIEDPTENAYYLAYGPSETSVDELIWIAGRRWR